MAEENTIPDWALLVIRYLLSPRCGTDRPCGDAINFLDARKRNLAFL